MPDLSNSSLTKRKDPAESPTGSVKQAVTFDPSDVVSLFSKTPINELNLNMKKVHNLNLSASRRKITTSFFLKLFWSYFEVQQCRETQVAYSCEGEVRGGGLWFLIQKAHPSSRIILREMDPHGGSLIEVREKIRSETGTFPFNKTVYFLSLRGNGYGNVPFAP